MDFDYIETLAAKCNNNDKKAKELLALEFKPLILNLSKKTFIDGYSTYDIQNECYVSLFYCINKYNFGSHRFVSYATRAIKNNLYALLKKKKGRSVIDGNETLTLTDNLEHILGCNLDSVEDVVFTKFNLASIMKAIKTLNEEEKEIINYIFFDNHTTKDYSIFKNIPYSTANSRKINALSKLFNKLGFQKTLEDHQKQKKWGCRTK